MAPPAGTAGVGLWAAGFSGVAGAVDSGGGDAGLGVGELPGAGAGDDDGVGSPGVGGALLSTELVGEVGVVEVVVVVVGVCRCTSVRGAQV